MKTVTTKKPVEPKEEKQPEKSKVCPHWKRATDGVHAVLIDQCKNPDCEKWFQG